MIARAIAEDTRDEAWLLNSSRPLAGGRRRPPPKEVARARGVGLAGTAQVPLRLVPGGAQHPEAWCGGRWPRRPRCDSRGALESTKPNRHRCPPAEADWGRTVGFLDAIAGSQGLRCRHPTPPLVERTRMASQSPRDPVTDHLLTPQNAAWWSSTTNRARCRPSPRWTASCWSTTS